MASSEQDSGSPADTEGWLVGKRHARPHPLLRRVVTALVVLVVAAVLFVVAIAVLALRKPIPDIRFEPLLASQSAIKGPKLAIAWPAAGQAAVEVEGVGSFGTSGRQRPAPIASLAKMMTALVVVHDHPIGATGTGFTLTITPAEVVAEQQEEELGQSVLPVRAGEVLTERQALEALMLPSANNVAQILAGFDAGSVGAFVKRMNAEAKALGMDSTTYSDPSGYDRSTVSTAHDQLLLATHLMSDTTLASIVRMPSVAFPYGGDVDNYDALAGKDGYVGIKTGSTEAAGGCFAFDKVESVGGRKVSVIGVVLGQRGGPIIPAALAAGRRLGNSIATQVRRVTVLPKGTAVARAQGVQGRSTRFYSSANLETIGWTGLTVRLHAGLPAPARSVVAGKTTVTISLAGRQANVVLAPAAANLPAPDFLWRMEHAL